MIILNLKNKLLRGRRPVQTVCCKCGYVIRKGRKVHGKYVTHGYCNECLREVLREIENETSHTRRQACHY